MTQDAAGGVGPRLALDAHLATVPQHVRPQLDTGLFAGPRHRLGVSIGRVAVTRGTPSDGLPAAGSVGWREGRPPSRPAQYVAVLLRLLGAKEVGVEVVVVELANGLAGLG